MAPSSSDPNAIRAVLTKPQRTALPRLINNITAQMRSSIEHSFETTDPESSNLFQQQHQDEWETEPSARASHSDVDERDRQISESLENRLSKPKMERLKRAALRYFDDWQRKVMSRLGEVVHSQEVPPYTPRPVPSQSQTKKELEGISVREAEDLSVLRELYYPLPTKFSTLPKDVRVILISSMLLLLLSLGHYSAHSRVLLLHLTSSFELPLSILTNEETEIARSLLLASKELTADAETQKRQEENKTARRWKVGLASVAGAAVIGITGGLAAPIVAGGIGALMGGVGLGGLASFLGIFAMNGALVGTLFGAFGGKMTGSMVDAYAKEVDDFKFLPVKDEWGIARKEDEDNDRRLRVTIGINGWLTKKDDVIKPWRSMGQATEVFALRYEMDALIELGTSLKSMVSSYAWSYVKVEILKRTVLASLWSALWPVYLLKMATSIDNPFGLARTRSEKAGEVLADALINKAQGERPVTLIGYSLGARVIYSCLMSLAERNAFGLVESVVFIGAPIPSNAENWRVMRSVVSGVMTNVYSENDYILAFLYRATSIQFGVAGLQAIKDIEGITNLELSKDVSGHLRYPDLIGKILKRVGGIDVKVENANIESEVGEKEILLMDTDDDDVALSQMASRGEALNLKDKPISGDKDLLRIDDSSGGEDKLKDTKHNSNDEETKPENYEEESDDDSPLQLVNNDPEEDDYGPLQLVEAKAVPEEIAELSAETRHTVKIEDSPEEQKVVFPRDEQKSLASMPKELARRVRASDLGLY